MWSLARPKSKGLYSASPVLINPYSQCQNELKMQVITYSCDLASSCFGLTSEIEVDLEVEVAYPECESIRGRRRGSSSSYGWPRVLEGDDDGRTRLVG